MTKQYSLITVPDRESEPFTMSTCQCSVCRDINASSEEWSSLIPKSRLQTRMMDVIKRIEKRALKENRKKNNLKKYYYK